ncbi:DNA mismatch repair protein MutS [Mesonia sp. MT50]|uniref:DNA mismatch repair protein MutS n=1 Tax=Mesonia profundi TaxID=3070998 RepID=A0ABU1A169_9FLAO|nr:Smr/MutS family protein [Mesonia profundi]MDQ7917412.1 DNA mismatch repair protein MutS [Mesonia profundi]
MIKVGDWVEVLDEAIAGFVQNIEHETIFLETDDGFVMSFDVSEVVKTGTDEISVKEEDIKNALKEKLTIKKSKNVRKKREKGIPAIEIDLHIEKLTDRRHLDNFDMLNIQMDTARHRLEHAIRNRIQKLVFIHGVGEGVLKAELETLFGRYEQINYYEADPRKYGYGATEVFITQS